MIYYDGKEFEQKQYNTYILNKYLTKHYGNEVSKQIIVNHTDKLSKVARDLGSKDIEFFNLYYLQDIFVVKDDNEARVLAPGHYEMWRLANKVFIDDDLDKVNIACPRGYAKTTVFDMALSIWLICYGKSKFTLLGAKRDDDAQQFIDSIKKIFEENKFIITEFGYLINKKAGFTVNSNEIEFTNDMYIRAVGSGTSVRGANFKGVRPTVVICDDFQDEKNILTDEAREKVYNKWTKEIEQVGDKAVFRNGKKIKSATKVICIGTVLHNNCLISRLSRNRDYYTLLKRAIILEPDQTVEDIFENELWLKCKRLYFNDKDEYSKETARQFYLDNIESMKFPILWEDKWDCFNDLAIAYWENRQAFMSELMNDATSIGEKWFKSVLTRSRDEIEDHSFVKTMLCIDPASTTNKKSDYTAMVVGSEADNDFKYMRKLILDKLSFNEYCDLVIKLLKEFNDITHVYIEKNTFQGADVIKIKELILNEPELSIRRIEFINEMQRKNKDEKISTIIDSINNGQIIFVDDNKDFTQQILDFQGQLHSVHDDAPDIVAECFNRLKIISSMVTVKLLDRRSLGV